MQVVLFHLMPYADLDLEAGRKNGTVWVKLPNKHFDPEKGHKLYNRYLDELEYGEQLGFDAVSVNEHHQTAYGLMPSPIVTASALARKTKRVKIAILGSALPLRSHPLTVAEEHAMIDVISGGRLISGFVRGIGAEYHTFGVNPTFSHDRFHEAHDLIVRGVDRAGAVRVPGQALQRAVREPLAAALPEAASADLDPVAGQQGNHRLGRASRPALHLPADLQPVEGGGALPQEYRDTCKGYGYQAKDSQLGWAVPVYVGEEGRKRPAGSKGALREFPQRVRAHAARDAPAAGLYLARINEERDEGEGADVRRRDARAGGGARAVRCGGPRPYAGL